MTVKKRESFEEQYPESAQKRCKFFLERSRAVLFVNALDHAQKYSKLHLTRRWLRVDEALRRYHFLKIVCTSYVSEAPLSRLRCLSDQVYQVFQI